MFDPRKTVFYDVDTTKGNSGSPDLSGIEDGTNHIQGESTLNSWKVMMFMDRPH